MKIAATLLALSASTASAFVVQPSASRVAASTSLNAEIRPPSKKNEVLEFGWDGTTALGGAEVDSQPARMLDEIRAAGEVQSDACDLFNANLGELIAESIG